ncbi:hypothetical protein ACTXT7_011322 [Hymenolepis weldensis]
MNQQAGDQQNADRHFSRGRSIASSNRLAMLLRSSLRLSAPRRKSSISSARSLTAPTSPNLTGIPRPFMLKRVSSTISGSSLGYPFCRICHDSSVDETLGRLIAPCLCDGSLKYVHEKCIQRWIDISNSKRCELCHFEYEMNSYTKPLKEASVAWALYALITNLASPGVSTPRYVWQFWLKVFVILIGISCVGIFAYVQIRYCFGMCKRWRRINRVCLIQEPSGERLAKLRLELRSSSLYGQDETFTSLP